MTSPDDIVDMTTMEVDPVVPARDPSVRDVLARLDEIEAKLDALHARMDADEVARG